MKYICNHLYRHLSVITFLIWVNFIVRFMFFYIIFYFHTHVLFHFQRSVSMENGVLMENVLATGRLRHARFYMVDPNVKGEPPKLGHAESKSDRFIKHTCRTM